MSRHDDGKPDYLQRLRASFRAGKPLIKELEPFVGEAPKERILVPFEPGDAKCLGKPKRLAATILDPVFRALGLDDNGIPISFGMFPGNTLDHHKLRPAMEKTVDSLGLKRFVLVADRGMYSGTNMCHVTDAGNGYIVAKSLRKSTRKETVTRKFKTNGDIRGVKSAVNPF